MILFKVLFINPLSANTDYSLDAKIKIAISVINLVALSPTFFQNPLDGHHKVRVAVGNGLRADIWEKFKERYRIPNICEFFAATEGTAGFVNLSNRTGSCGRYSPIMVCVFFFNITFYVFYLNTCVIRQFSNHR